MLIRLSGLQNANDVVRHEIEFTHHQHLTLTQCCLKASYGDRSRSTLPQATACCLTTPSPFLSQCSPIIRAVLWHPPECYFTRNTQEFNRWIVVWKLHYYKYLPCQWVQLGVGILINNTQKAEAPITMGHIWWWWSRGWLLLSSKQRIHLRGCYSLWN